MAFTTKSAKKSESAEIIFEDMEVLATLSNESRPRVSTLRAKLSLM